MKKRILFIAIVIFFALAGSYSQAKKQKRNLKTDTVLVQKTNNTKKKYNNSTSTKKNNSNTKKGKGKHLGNGNGKHCNNHENCNQQHK